MSQTFYCGSEGCFSPRVLRGHEIDAFVRELAEDADLDGFGWSGGVTGLVVRLAADARMRAACLKRHGQLPEALPGGMIEISYPWEPNRTLTPDDNKNLEAFHGSRARAS